MIPAQDKRSTITYDFIPEHKYEVVVRAIGPDGTRQAMEEAARNAIIIKGKQEAPASPTNLTATGFLNSITLTWVNPANYDFDHVEIWRSVTDDRTAAFHIANAAGITYIDPLGGSGITRYYWVRAVNTSGLSSNYYPDTDAGISATTLGVVATDIDDFAVNATKLFTNTVVLAGDAWTNNSPSAGKIAWNEHYLVYGGAYYRVEAGNTNLRYVIWTMMNEGGSGTVADPYLTSYGKVASYSHIADTFVIAVNESGVAQLVWNASANMVIGTAFIIDAAITNAKIDTMTASKLTAGTIDASLITVINLNASNISTGTLTGRTIQTAASGARVQLFPDANTGLVIYDNGGAKVFEALIAGTDIGDVIIGNYAGDEGAKYDKSAGTFDVKAKLTTKTGSVVNTPYLSGLVPQSNLNIANQSWYQTCVFSVTDADTVAWGAGTLNMADGTTYNISAGNTGNMAAKTYIYFNTGFPTQYTATATQASAVGTNQVLVAVAENGTSEATFSLTETAQIVADNIVANAITAGHLAADIVLAGKIITGLLTADNIQTGTLTGLVVQTDTGEVDHYKRIKLDASDNTLRFYNPSNVNCFTVDDDIEGGGKPGVVIGDTNGGFLSVKNNVIGVGGTKRIDIFDGYVEAYNNSTGSIYMVRTARTGASGTGTNFLAANNAGVAAALFKGTVNSITMFNVGATGVVTAADSYEVGANKVVGAQGAAVADATDAASVILRLNDLLARCRAHGLIAT